MQFSLRCQDAKSGSLWAPFSRKESPQMSETRLNIVDAETIHEGTLHASIGDLCVAALSAEPANFAELQSALTRYMKIADDRLPLEALRPSTRVTTEPWDAGIAIIDL